MAAAGLLLGGMGVFAGGTLGTAALAEGHPDPSPPPSSSSSSSSSPSSSSMLSRNFIADAAERALPSVVNIQCSGKGPWGQRSESSGSGFVVSSDGMVVTNKHVVDSARAVKVTMSDGRQYRARVHAKDGQTDLAVVQILAPKGTVFPTITVGSSSGLRPGEWVLALGSPLTLQNTVTAGIVSSTARQSSEIGMPQQHTEYIQTDAAINQGNSGGPLVNMDGEVIGINTMKVAYGSGISFAIPIDSAWLVIKQLLSSGGPNGALGGGPGGAGGRRLVRPFLGMKVMMLTPAIIERERRFNRSLDANKAGVLVVQVIPGSPADQGGLQAGDIIVAFDDKPVTNTRHILERVGSEIGRKINVTLLRDGTEHQVVVETSESTSF